ncbi:DUF4912 domain-containing protein [Paenibacillus sp. GCM10023248]|uniref:DUF4912 domain-containing protein n=1 Tax=Bacillus sp. 3255 TaxID=2817904 RepID=UPI00286AC405|nr:DUF4912 domain-containing protein [Bacillus sp. 3255]MDD9266427.1 DUF4912 domain-containing protein [Paenibacillus sp. MAHUQ-63]
MSDRDALHLLVQTPTNLFAYWQLSARKKRMVQEHFNRDWLMLEPLLRFYEIDEQAGCEPPSLQAYELPLPQGDSCFLSGFEPGLRYFAELGIRNGQGQFLPLLRSNPIQTPHIHTHQVFPSNLTDQVTYRPAAVPLQLLAPEADEQFSAYSVYVPKRTYTAETEFGGDCD